MLFDYQPRTRVVFGVNSIERVGDLAKSLAARKVLLVTDSGIVAGAMKYCPPLGVVREIAGVLTTKSR